MGFSCGGLSRCGTRAPEHRFCSCRTRLRCCAARGIFLDRGWSPCVLHGPADSQPLGPPEKSPAWFRSLYTKLFPEKWNPQSWSKEQSFRPPPSSVNKMGLQSHENAWCSLPAKDANWLLLLPCKVARTWFGAVMMRNLGIIKKPSYCFMSSQERKKTQMSEAI